MVWPKSILYKKSLVCILVVGALFTPRSCSFAALFSHGYTDEPFLPPTRSLLPSEHGALLGAYVPVFLRLRGGEEGSEAADLTEEQAHVLLDSAGEEATALLRTLSDYRESAQVQQQGCHRIVNAFAAAAVNVTDYETLRSCYMSAAGVKCVLGSLRVHIHGALPLVASLCKALGVLLKGPPNHAPEGDFLHNASCSSTAMRVECGRAGAAELALALIKAHAEAAQEASSEDAGAVEVVCGAYYIIEMLLMDYENKVLLAQMGALPLFVQHLKTLSKHPSLLDAAAAVLINCACAHDENKLLIASEGAIPHILAFMDAHMSNPRVLARGCAIMCNLAAEESQHLQKQLASQGAVPRVISAMETYPDDAGVQQECCAVLMNLAHGNPENRDLIRAAGAERLARAALKKHRRSLHVERFAQWCLNRLAQPPPQTMTPPLPQSATATASVAVSGSGSAVAAP